MSEIDLLAKIEQAGLVGRGGASFPVHLKWQRIKSVASPKKFYCRNDQRRHFSHGFFAKQRGLLKY